MPFLLRFTASSALALAFPAFAFAQPTTTPAAQSVNRVEAEAERAFATFAPTGMAVALIENGRLVFARGYGVREAGGAQPVDADTVFPIASITKSFTAAALAMLVDEGRIDWDDPVIRHLPEFAMADPYVTQNMTVRDLLVHRSGLALGAGDLLTWPDSRAEPAEVIAALRHLPLDQGFRSGFIYDNSLYIVAGEIVARVSGMSWAEFVAARIFEPLGMRSCSADPHAPRSANRVREHARARSDAAPVPLPNAPTQPDAAGSIACSVRDLARWAQFQLDGGVAPDDTRLISEAAMRALHSGVTPMRIPGIQRRLANGHFALYGLGWILSDFRGLMLVGHGGTAPGAQSDLALLPERNSAAVVLVNDQWPATVLTSQLLDRIAVGDAAADWIGDVARRMAARESDDAASGQLVAPDDAAPPAHALDAYVGTYRDPWYGIVHVSREGDGLVLHLTRSRLLRGPLLPHDGETFVAHWPDRSLNADAFVTFESDASGRPSRMRLRAISEHTDFSYDYHHLAPVRVAE